MIQTTPQAPMFHIDAYILAKHGQKILPLLTSDDIKNILVRYFGHIISDQDLFTFIAKCSKDKIHEVKALAALGIPQITIADYLGISQGMVSRYMKKVPDNHFNTLGFQTVVRNWYAKDGQQEWKYYYHTYCQDFTGIKFNSI